MGGTSSSPVNATFERIKNMSFNDTKDMLATFNEHVMFFGIGEKELALLLGGDTDWAKDVVQQFSKNGDM
jgi:hypothetical protein